MKARKEAKKIKRENNSLQRNKDQKRIKKAQDKQKKTMKSYLFRNLKKR